jgi:cytochrome c553
VVKARVSLLAVVACATVGVAFPSLRTLAQQATEALPTWAFTPRVPIAPQAAPLDDTMPLHVPGSTAGYTAKYIADLSTVTDWFPDSHPKMPEVVESGHKPGGFACAHCHLPNGLGGPENANLAGQSEAYMAQQIEDFKSGARTSSAKLLSFSTMVRVAKEVTPEEIKASTAYFASLKPQKWVRVVETDTVPVTHPGVYILVPNTPAAMEPIGDRVIEVPVAVERTEKKDSSASYIAYVPKGSLKRGEELVKTGGGGKTLPCATCHGPTLHGVGAIPSIAGRTPSGMTRQIFDIKGGARNGAGAALMKPVVANLTTADVVAITGYLASLEP